MAKYSLWAQALDNISDDHLVLLEQELTPDQTHQRQQVVSLVSTVVKKGSVIFDQTGIKLTADKRHFVIEVPSVERDSRGRIAPLICIAEQNPEEDEGRSNEVFNRLEQFAKSLGRTLAAENKPVIHQAFDELKKKSATAISFRRWGLITVGVVVLIMILRKMVG